MACRPASVSSGRAARPAIDAVISANAAASAEFRNELAKLVSCTAAELDARLEKAWMGQDPDFLRLFCAGLGKWLLHLAGGATPPRELTLLGSCYYQVRLDGPDILSLAFRCDSQQPSLADPFGILPDAAPQAAFSEVQAALRMARSLSDSLDLDLLLVDKPALTTKLIGQAGRLLATARYREDAHEEWARREVERTGRFA